ARALRCDHADGDGGRRLDQIEVDVQAVPEEQRIALFQIRLDVVSEDVGLCGIGSQQHDHVGPLGDLGGRVHLEALLGDLLSRLRAFLQAHLHLHAGVAQGKRVRMALAAVADDTDLASLDDRQVRVVVIEHLNCHFEFPSLLTLLIDSGSYLAVPIPRGPRDSETTPDCTSSRIPYGSSTRNRASNFSGVPVASTVSDSVETSTTLARKRFTASMTWLRVVASARTLISASSRSTELSGSCSTILITLMSLFSCLVICSSGESSTLTTMVIRDMSFCSVAPTASD